MKKITVAATAGTVGLAIAGLAVSLNNSDMRTYRQTEGDYVVDKEMNVERELRIEGGTFRMSDKAVRVNGDFFLSKEATFIPSTAPLIFSADAKIHVEKRTRAWMETKLSGDLLIPIYKSEQYTPSLGNVVIE